MKITYKQIKRLLNYDHKTGIFTWKMGLAQIMELKKMPEISIQATEILTKLISELDSTDYALIPYIDFAKHVQELYT